MRSSVGSPPPGTPNSDNLGTVQESVSLMNEPTVSTHGSTDTHTSSHTQGLESPSSNMESLRQNLESPSQNLESLREDLESPSQNLESPRHQPIPQCHRDDITFETAALYYSHPHPKIHPSIQVNLYRGPNYIPGDTVRTALDTG